MAIGLGGEIAWWCPTIKDSPEDLSGNGYHMSYRSGASTISDTQHGGKLAYDFNGSSSYMQYSQLMPLLTPITLSHWVKADTAQTNGDYIRNNLSGAPRNWSVICSNRASHVAIFMGTIDQLGTVSGLSALPVNNWVHVLQEFDGTNFKVWRNGSLDFQQTYSPQVLVVGSSSPWFRLGRGGSTYFDGKLDDIRIFNRILTDEERGLLFSRRGYQPGNGLLLRRRRLITQ